MAEVEISFADGTTVSAQLKPVAVVHPPYMPTARLLDQYDELARMAMEGDAPAARMLYRALKQCGLVFTDRATRGTTAGQELERGFQYCEGVSEELLEEKPHWAEMAAAGGDYLGRQDWARELGNTQEGFEVRDAFWKDGNISTLPMISYAYWHGVPASVGGQPDYLRAYAYHLIYFKVQEAAQAMDAEATGFSRRLGTIGALEDHQRYLGSMLNPQQQEEAEALAADLLRQNHNCCIGSF